VCIQNSTKLLRLHNLFMRRPSRISYEALMLLEDLDMIIQQTVVLRRPIDIQSLPKWILNLQ
jgi:hypothetical protein